MLKMVMKKIRDNRANSLVENVIILPVIFLIIYFMIMFSFVLHDRATMDSAAKRGSIFAARCINDPGYISILNKTGHDKGVLDTNIQASSFSKDSFSEVGDNIDPYRYFHIDKGDIERETKAEVEGIVNKTLLPGRKVEPDNIKVNITNYVVYQKVDVTIQASYPLPSIFEIVGLPTDYKYSVTATTTVNDPDEFIRNVDLIIDTAVKVDEKTGGNLSKLAEKISGMATKLLKFLEISN